MIYLINTFLGFLIAQLYDVLKRSKTSDASPQKFDLVFFLKDTWQKILVSLLLSFTLSIFLHLNIVNLSELIGKDWTGANDLLYGVIGFAPEIALQWLKKKYGFLQPTEVDEFQRK